MKQKKPPKNNNNKTPTTKKKQSQKEVKDAILGIQFSPQTLLTILIIEAVPLFFPCAELENTFIHSLLPVTTPEPLHHGPLAPSLALGWILLTKPCRSTGGFENCACYWKVIRVNGEAFRHSQVLESFYFKYGKMQKTA